MISAGARVFVATKPVDFHDGPASLMALFGASGADPFSGALYVFRARRAYRVKIVWWDGTGLCLFARLLDEHGFHWSLIEDGVIRLSAAQLMALVGGIDSSRVRAANERRPLAIG
jgi:transposase